MTPKQLVLSTAITATRGKWMSVTFIKKDGTVRKMNGRIAVTKHLSGGNSTTAHLPHIFTIWDREKKAYRNVNLDTIIKFKCGNVYYNEEEASA